MELIRHSIREMLHKILRFQLSIHVWFVGRIFYEKGINELVASFIRLQKDYPNIGLRLIGFMEENLYPVDDWVKQEISTNSHIEFVAFNKMFVPI